MNELGPVMLWPSPSLAVSWSCWLFWSYPYTGRSQLSFCQFASLSVCLFLSISQSVNCFSVLYLSVYASVSVSPLPTPHPLPFLCLSLCLCLCVLISVSLCLPLPLSVCLSVRPSVRLSVCLYVFLYLYLCLSVCLSVCLSLSLSPLPTCTLTQAMTKLPRVIDISNAPTKFRQTGSYRHCVRSSRPN